jgi:hypothetical protein
MNDIRKFALTMALELEHINQSKMQSAIIRERDPKTVNLEREVYSKLAALSVDNQPVRNPQANPKPSDHKVLTPEEAMKELAEMEAKGLIK